MMTQIRKRKFEVRSVRMGISITMSSSLYMKKGQLELVRSEVKCFRSLTMINNIALAIGAPVLIV